MIHPCDGQTDGQSDGWTGDSALMIYAICCAHRVRAIKSHIQNSTNHFLG